MATKGKHSSNFLVAPLSIPTHLPQSFEFLFVSSTWASAICIQAIAL